MNFLAFHGLLSLQNDILCSSLYQGAVWYKLNRFVCGDVYGDVKRKAGVRSTLSAVARRKPVA